MSTIYVNAHSFAALDLESELFYGAQSPLNHKLSLLDLRSGSEPFSENLRRLLSITFVHGLAAGMVGGGWTSIKESFALHFKTDTTSIPDARVPLLSRQPKLKTRCRFSSSIPTALCLTLTCLTNLPEPSCSLQTKIASHDGSELSPQILAAVDNNESLLSLSFSDFIDQRLDFGSGKSLLLQHGNVGSESICMDSLPALLESIEKLILMSVDVKLEDCSPLAFSTLRKASQTSSCKGHERSFSTFLRFAGVTTSIKVFLHEKDPCLGCIANDHCRFPYRLIPCVMVCLGPEGTTILTPVRIEVVERSTSRYTVTISVEEFKGRCNLSRGFLVLGFVEEDGVRIRSMLFQIEYPRDQISHLPENQTFKSKQLLRPPRKVPHLEDKKQVRVRNVPLHNRLLRSILKNATVTKSPPPRYLLGSPLPLSPQKCRSRKFRDRPSPPGPLGKPQSITTTNDESMSKLQRVPIEFASVEEEEEVEQIVQRRIPLTAPLGVSITSKRKSVCRWGGTCQNSGKLPDTMTSKTVLEKKLEKEGMKLMDSASVLNNGLDAFITRLIKPCLSLVQRQRVSMLDLRAAMELNPRVLGED
uniref:Uncharacterized protein n=1 Tax=Brassica oleracea var. oleracea TaxID=109376 RepID=A0A0D3D437_BRAOL